MSSFAIGRYRASTVAVLALISVSASAQLRVANWNITNYTSGRVNEFRTALFSSFEGRSFNPDVIAVQELTSATAADNFLAILNGTPGQTGQWAYVFGNTGDTDGGFFYRTAKVEVFGSSLITGDPRSTHRVDFRLKGYQASGVAQREITMYASHLKAGSTADDQARRLTETTNIRNNAASLPAGRHFLWGADTNTQSSNQAAYQQLVSATPNSGAGRFFDPINSPGSWNNNNSFRFLFTQDPIGAGGMDDRHDQILIGGSLRDGSGLEYIGSATQAYSTSTWNDPNHSYRAWGNDGTTNSDGSLRTTGNTMVGATIAQALKDSTGNFNVNNTGGHLPVFLDLRVPADIGLSTTMMDFGTLMMGSSGNTLGLSVQNAVDTSIWGVSGVQRLNYSFSVTGDFSAPAGTFGLDAGQSLASIITMSTATEGTKNGVLTITEAGTGLRRTVSLTGIVAVPEPGTFIAMGVGIAAFLRRRKKS